MTVPQLNLLAGVLSEKAEAENENQIYYHYLGSNLNSYAYHEPKKMPKLKVLLPAKKRTAIDKQEHEEMKKQGNAIGMRVP